MSRFTILLGGDLSRTPRLEHQIADTRIIAADGGISHAVTLGVTPELWVGDFDSIPDHLPSALKAVPTEAFPREKDKTDGELAIDIAMRHGATELVLAGAFGGPRADHAFLHLALALKLAESGITALLTSGSQEGQQLLPGPGSSFDYDDGTLFSVLGFSDLSGLSVEGAKWPLARVDVAFGSSLTISNEVRGQLRIALEKGRAMLIAHPEPCNA